MIGGLNNLHNVEPRPPEDLVTRGLNVYHVELCDDVVRVNVNWECNRAWRMRLIPIKPIR